jgi:hypothetical protein
MKKKIAIICNVASLIIILYSVGAGYKIMMFLLAGIIPGTNIALSSTQMLILIIVLISAILARVGALPLLHKFNLTNTKRTKLTIRHLNHI